MAILCSDLYNIQGLEGLIQIAGHGGNHREIKWVCKLDSMEISNKVSDVAQNGDLIFVLGSNLIQDKKSISQCIEEANRYHAAGLIMCYEAQHVEMITCEAAELSEQLQFPLFELDIDKEAEKKTLKEICRAIVVDSLNDTPGKNILESVLMNEKLESEYSEERFRSYGININSMNQIGIFKFIGFDDTTKEKYQEDDKISKQIVHELNDSIQNVFVSNCPPRNVMTVIKNDCVVFLTVGFTDNDEIADIIFKIYKELKVRIPGANISFGLGCAYSGISGVCRSYHEARQMMKLKKIEGLHCISSSLKHLEVYLFLVGVKEQMLLENYTAKVIGPLLAHDKLNQAELTDTLDMYLNENANTANASDKLFIHKNTLKYRLKKIENLLNVDLHSLEDCLRLLLAIKAHKVLKMPLEEQDEDLE